MPKTTLHIGTTKTGSTSIQQFLAKNREVLLSNGVLYPSSLGDVPHNAIPAATVGRFAGTSHQKMYDLKDEEGYLRFIQERSALLADEIVQSQPEQILISSEHMHSRCTNSVHFDVLKSFLSSALESRELTIVAYLRPQIEHAISLYTTMLSHGTKVDIDTFIRERMVGSKRRYHDPKKLITTWKKQFPSAKLIVRSFDACKQFEHGVVSDFVDVTGLASGVGDFAFFPRANKSMSAWAAEAMRMLNGMDDYDAKSRSWIKRWLRKDKSGGKILPSVALSRSFQASFDAENKWVSNRFFDKDQSVMQPDWDRIGNPDPIPTIDEAELRNKFTEVLATRKR